MAALIVYFSRAGENYVCGTLRQLAVGNTQVAAGLIAELTGAGLFKLEPVVAYADDYNTCIEEARQDKKRDARPELAAWPHKLDDIDTIFLGYPNYWGTMPMAVFTFLEGFDATSKTIFPFCTHEGSGLGSSERDIAALCPGAQIKPGLAICSARVTQAKPAIEQWLHDAAID